MDNRLQTLERALSSSPTDCAAFLRFIHHHTRISGLLTPAELTKVHELLDTGDWLPGTVNKFGRIELIHAQTEMVFVVLPTGTYTMGDKDGDEDEQPAHKVAIDDVHLMGKYPVTQGQWRKVMGANPSTFSNEKKSEKKGESDYDWDNHPVETVSWLDCQDFMKKTGLRLPPENGWEYACRAGTKERFHAAANDDPTKGGSTEEHLKLIAVFGRDYEDGHAAVGTKQPNSWGIYDMLGNVWDWQQDQYHDSYVGSPPDCRPWNATWDTRRKKLIQLAEKRGLLTHDEGDELLNPREEPDFDLFRKADAAILTLLREAKKEQAKKSRVSNGRSSKARNGQVAGGQNMETDPTQDRTPGSVQGSQVSQPQSSTDTGTSSTSAQGVGLERPDPDLSGSTTNQLSGEDIGKRSSNSGQDIGEHTSATPGDSDAGPECPDPLQPPSSVGVNSEEGVNGSGSRPMRSNIKRF
jgi:formylglycine-generating enzyme required for sulfatase activity